MRFVVEIEAPGNPPHKSKHTIRADDPGEALLLMAKKAQRVMGEGKAKKCRVMGMYIVFDKPIHLT